MITSKENELVKHVKALSQKKYRDEFREFIVEGPKMVLEALEYAKVSSVIVCEEYLNDEKVLNKINKLCDKSSIRLEYASSKVFDSISDTKTPQGVIAVAKQNEVLDIEKSIDKMLKDDTIFALDKIQDPGNLGTIIRSLDSAGIKHLILSKDTVDAYNPKVVRSTMGAIFRLKIYTLEAELFEVLQSLSKRGATIVSTSLDTDKYIYDIDFNKKLVVVIGNESQGVSKEIQDMSDYKFKIPMIGKTESLNAAVAASIVAYEKVRRNFRK